MYETLVILGTSRFTDCAAETDLRSDVGYAASSGNGYRGRCVDEPAAASMTNCYMHHLRQESNNWPSELGGGRVSKNFKPPPDWSKAVRLNRVYM